MCLHPEPHDFGVYLQHPEVRRLFPIYVLVCHMRMLSALLAKARCKSLEEPVCAPRESIHVRLTSAQVNLKRTRLWKEHDTDSVLFDVKLIASDRDIHCNRHVKACCGHCRNLSCE